MTKARILIVDDNAGIRRLLRRAIAEIAADVWECEDGDEALIGFETHHPDVVLMDIRMRRMDGLQATKQIRVVHPYARIVVVSDYEDEALRQAAKEAGACGYVHKQNLTGLAQVVAALL
jgi:CheY-like chemotaxis protein